MTISSLRKRLACGLTLLAVIAGCSTPQPVSVIDSYCDSYKPVCLSRSDTQKTIDQVMANERVFVALCPIKAAAVQCK